MRPPWPWWLGLALAVAGCNAILGLNPSTLDLPDVGTFDAEGSSSDGTIQDDAGSSDGGTQIVDGPSVGLDSTASTDGSPGDADGTAPNTDAGGGDATAGRDSGGSGDGSSNAEAGDGGDGGDGRIDAGDAGGGGDGGGSCPLPGKALTMIDDGSELAPASILGQCGRSGPWFTFHDPTSSQTPAAGAPVPITTSNTPNGVAGYVETTGVLSNSSYYGAGIGFNLNNPGTTPQSYSASTYSGISFWIRIAESGSAQPVVLFQVIDVHTAPYNNGNYYHVAYPGNPPANVWTKYSFTWSQLHQNTVTEASVDTSALVTVQWQLNGSAPTTGTPQPFDFAVGDIEFTP
jgi:hypothetical protein